MNNILPTTRGAAMITFVLFFAFAASAVLLLFGRSIFADLADFHRLSDSKRTLLAAESLTDDVVYRHVFGTFNVDSIETLTLGPISVQTNTTYDPVDDTYVINTTAQSGSTIRKSYAELSITSGSAFNYGLQAGNGGIDLDGNSSIVGNVYSNGLVTGSTNAEIFGDVVSAGPSGHIQNITATGTVHANTIEDITIDKDAYYNVALGSNTIGGTAYSPAANLATTSFPISTTTIQEWKDFITDHGTTIAATSPACSGGTYTIDTSVVIGTLKIECDVLIDKNTTIVTLTGPLWIEGDLTFKSGPELRAAPTLGRRSVQVLVDNPIDHTNSSVITIQNSTDFTGSGDDRSYIMLMSMNDSAENGGGNTAIDIINSANGDVLMYAASGLVDIANNIDLREVTGYQINISNGSSVTYESGLASLVFTSGPGGEYVLTDWQQGI